MRGIEGAGGGEDIIGVLRLQNKQLLFEFTALFDMLKHEPPNSLKLAQYDSSAAFYIS